MGCCMWIRATNMISIIGVLRSGGDTRFGFFLDAGTVWLIGVPIALLGAFVLELERLLGVLNGDDRGIC